MPAKQSNNSNSIQKDDPASGSGGEAATSQGQLFGEAVWLLSQSPLHKHLALKELEWLVMTPLMLGQMRLFRAGAQAIGLASWGYLDEAGEASLADAGRLQSVQWHAGLDMKATLKALQAGEKRPEPNPSVDTTLWLVDFICPFATAENKLADACMADLLQGPLKGERLKMHKTDIKTGEKTVVELGAEK